MKSARPPKRPNNTTPRLLATRGRQMTLDPANRLVHPAGNDLPYTLCPITGALKRVPR